MQKIANLLTGRTILPGIGTNVLPFSAVTQTVLDAPTATDAIANLRTHKLANLTSRIITLTKIMGDDAVPKLLVEETTETVSEPTNDLITTQQTFTGPVATIIADFETWKVANPYQKVVRATQIDGADGSVALLVEHGISSLIPNLQNSAISQTFFADTGGVNTSAGLYQDWKDTAANVSLKPYRITYVKGSDGNVGILNEYTNFGTSPSVGSIILDYVPNDDSTNTTGVAGFPSYLSAKKLAAPMDHIYRVTEVFQGILIETVSAGSTPANTLVTGSAYTANPDAAQAATDYQTFKTANDTLKPIRLMGYTWGDGTNRLLAEYIS